MPMPVSSLWLLLSETTPHACYNVEAPIWFKRVGSSVKGREEIPDDRPHALLAEARIVPAMDDPDRQIEQALHARHVLPHLAGVALVISQRAVIDDVA